MLVKQARAVARRWVSDEATKVPGFSGAFFAGSINELPDDDAFPATSDVDVMVVLAGPDPPKKPGKLRYHDALLEISYVPEDQLRSPDQVLGHYHLAGNFRTPGIILDPSGRLTRLQMAVAGEYARRRWVSRRCEHARASVLRHLQSLNEAEPFHDQVTAWLFATGVTTQLLLVAGLKNPTVRRRYLAAQQLLAEYGRSAFYETLVALLGCAQMSRARAEHHLGALADVFDTAKTRVETRFFFASDISDVARPIAIDGSRELIERGHHREAVFWIVATYARCLKVLYHDAPAAMTDSYGHGFRHLLGDLGIASSADLRRRSEQVERFLPRLCEVAEAIMAANPEIES
jgi:hypothetical protein